MKPEPYQYGVHREGQTVVERMRSRREAMNVARDWCISPLRTGSRKAEAVRRRGWDGEWVTIATWRSPENYR